MGALLVAEIQYRNQSILHCRPMKGGNQQMLSSGLYEPQISVVFLMANQGQDLGQLARAGVECHFVRWLMRHELGTNVPKLV
jgi:hypothetical protein